MLMLNWNNLGERVKRECGRKGFSEGVWMRSLGNTGERKGGRCVEPGEGRWRREVDAGPELIR